MDSPWLSNNQLPLIAFIVHVLHCQYTPSRNEAKIFKMPPGGPRVKKNSIFSKIFYFYPKLLKIAFGIIVIGSDNYGLEWVKDEAQWGLLTPADHCWPVCVLRLVCRRNCSSSVFPLHHSAAATRAGLRPSCRLLTDCRRWRQPQNLKVTLGRPIF